MKILNRLRWLACLVAFVSLARADGPAQKNYDLEADDATVSLKSFSQQSGEQIIFLGSVVKGTTTHTVKGEFTASQALDLMLAGTGLYAVRDEKSGSFAVNRSPTAKPDNDPNAQRAALGVTESGRPEEKTLDETVNLERYIVTGSQIRGIGAGDEISPVTTYNRADIDRTGYSTTQELVQSIPENFRGGSLGASEDGIVGPGSLSQQNYSAASGVNLRGLGNNSTLVLINGHRAAPSDFGQVVDISAIPLAAIDRVDVLMDGASAIYGSDAVGGVVNFILRKDFNGAETRLSYDAAEGNRRQQEIATQTVGTSWGGGGGLITFQDRHSEALPAAVRSFTAGAHQPTDLYPAERQYNLLFSLHQEAGQHVEFFADGQYANSDVRRNETSSTFSFLDAKDQPYSYNGGIDLKLYRDWIVEAMGSFSRDDMHLSGVYAPAVRGYVNGGPLTVGDYATKAGQLKADGSLLSLAGGDLRVALGAEYRDESFDWAAPYQNLTYIFRRYVKSVFAEAYVPIVGNKNRMPFIRNLSVSVAMRSDRYSDFGSTNNPKAGLLWSPAPGLDFRGSASSAFRAPSAYEQRTVTSSFIYSYPGFSMPGGGTGPILLLLGGKPPLLPEKSKNLSLGFDYAPPAISGLKFSFNYYKIRYRDRIVSPPFNRQAIVNPSVYGSLITAFPDDASAQAFLNSYVAKGYQYINISTAGTTGVRYAYDVREQNASIVNQDGFDASVSYAFDVADSTFTAKASATCIDQIETAFTSASQPSDFSNVYGQPVHWRGRGDLSWMRGEWLANGAVNFVGGYTDTSVAPYGSVGAWTTFDFTVRYSPRAVKGLSVALSATNAFNRAPPYVVGASITGGVHYDPSNANPLGRVIGVEVRKVW